MGDIARFVSYRGNACVEGQALPFLCRFHTPLPVAGLDQRVPQGAVELLFCSLI